MRFSTSSCIRASGSSNARTTIGTTCPASTSGPAWKIINSINKLLHQANIPFALIYKQDFNRANNPLRIRLGGCSLLLHIGTE